MIKVSIHLNKDGKINGFRCKGHAGYAESGQDIVCSAVSILVINTINSIEQFTSDTFEYKEDEKSGLIEFKVVSNLSDRTEVLLSSLLLGLQGIEEGFGRDYIKIDKRIQ